MKEPLPPCDEDFALHETSPAYTCVEPSSPDEQPEPDDEIRRMSYNTRAELRELQRIMMDVARTDEFGSARASAARAWRDLEILRNAKLGKPLMLNVTGKGDAPKRNSEPPSIAIISDVASAA